MQVNVKGSDFRFALHKNKSFVDWYERSVKQKHKLIILQYFVSFLLTTVKSAAEASRMQRYILYASLKPFPFFTLNGKWRGLKTFKKACIYGELNLKRFLFRVSRTHYGSASVSCLSTFLSKSFYTNLTRK